MLPILVTAGHGLAWLAVTLGQLMLWGIGISFGFHVGKKAIAIMEGWGLKAKANKIAERLMRSKNMADTVAA